MSDNFSRRAKAVQDFYLKSEEEASAELGFPVKWPEPVVDDPPAGFERRRRFLAVKEAELRHQGIEIPEALRKAQADCDDFEAYKLERDERNLRSSKAMMILTARLDNVSDPK